MMGLDLAVPKLPKMELIPPKEAEVEGVYQEEGPFKGRIIYTERVLDVEATKASAKVRKDADGNEVWKKHPTTGEAIYPILDKEVKTRDIRYILVPNNRARTVKKITNFEITAEERAELERREAEKTFLQDFIAAALDEGLSPADVVARIKADTLGDDESLDQVEIDVTEAVVEEAAAEMGVDMIERNDEDVVSVEEGHKPEDETEQRPRKRKGKK